ncbi:MAG: hypothetical protein WC812_01390 [Candidatus Pacearchaeota archaeon]|jgi:hypothetical protein
MQFNIELPEDERGNIDFNKLERELSKNLSSNPQEDVCVYKTKDEKIVNFIKDYFINSYDFSVAISYKKDGDYLIKFSTDVVLEKTGLEKTNEAKFLDYMNRLNLELGSADPFVPLYRFNGGLNA